MRTAERRLHRLRYEAMDWCRAQSKPTDGRLTAHRDSVQWDPEVWGRD
jgi:hypothetical protein